MSGWLLDRPHPRRYGLAGLILFTVGCAIVPHATGGVSNMETMHMHQPTAVQGGPTHAHAHAHAHGHAPATADLSSRGHTSLAPQLVPQPKAPSANALGSGYASATAPRNCSKLGMALGSIDGSIDRSIDGSIDGSTQGRDCNRSLSLESRSVSHAISLGSRGVSHAISLGSRGVSHARLLLFATVYGLGYGATFTL